MIALALAAAEIAGVAVPASNPGCPTDMSEIVVCHKAIETDRYRLRQPLPDTPSPLLPRAEWGLGGGVRMGVATSAVELAPGIVSNRAMVKLKIPF